MKKRILAMAFFPAFVPPTSGGESRLYNFYRAISRFFDVTLLTSSYYDVEPQTINHGLGFVEHRIPKDNYFIEQYSRLSEYSGGGDLSGPSIAACSPYPTKLHYAFLDHYSSADIIIYDDPFVAGCDVFAGLDDKPRVYNSYNCESILYGQLHPGEKSFLLHDLVRDAELKLLGIADLVLYCAEADLKAFRKLHPSGTYAVAPAPNGMAPLALSAGRTSSESGQFVVLFMGSGHIPNVRAAEFIVEALAPRFPQVQFEIIGGCLKEGEFPSNVIRRGIVSDAEKRTLLQSANLALNPMEMGSGSNVKVLDFIAHGLPVLSTPFGMRGTDFKAGSDYVEAELEQFPAVLQDIVDGNIMLDQLAVNASSAAMERYSWESITASVAKALLQCLAEKEASDTPHYVLALNDYDSFTTLGGGGARTRGLYEGLNDWSSVVFVCFSHEGLLCVRKHSKQITVITVPITHEHQAEREKLDRVYHVSAADIVAARHTLENPILSKVYEVLRRFARCVVLEHCYMARLPQAYGDRFVYSSQNNETKLKEHWLAWHPLSSELIGEVEQLERYAVENSAAIVAVSSEDAQSFTAGRHSASPVIVVRNGALSPVSLPPEQASTLSGIAPGERSVVFLGSAHMPNIEAAEHIVHKIAPQCPDVQFHLVGSATCSIVEAPENVTLWGQVDDALKSAVLQSCSLAINPMVSGSGSNVKVSDFIGNGLFVISTNFGMRGYPESVKKHAKFVDIDDFPETILTAFRRPGLYSLAAKRERRELFDKELSMAVQSSRFVDMLKGLEVPRKRALFVTYRYTSPPLGGAEVMFEKFVGALGNSACFDIDIVAPELSGISNRWRFSETYSCADDIEAAVDISHVRFARYPLEEPGAAELERILAKAWQAQPLFERSVSNQLRDKYTESGLLWGWGYPESEGGHASRWALVSAGVFFAAGGVIKLAGHSPGEATISCRQNESIIAGPVVVNGSFELEFEATSGEVEITTSASTYAGDPRPLAFRLLSLNLSDEDINIAELPLPQQTLKLLSVHKVFGVLDRASDESRSELGVKLSDARGPWSPTLERFIENHVAEYDLVVTHNNIFRPTVFALEMAKKYGVPSILIPHAHLDDDFYHFPDIKRSAQGASLVLAAPKAACEFLAQVGCNVRYLPAGCDVQEQFLPSDIEAFQQVYPSAKPFALVLGRKAGAKGYKEIIAAIDELCVAGTNVHVVLIGPDDDGEPVVSPNASYLGRQPRDVVRGALQASFALCNMSVSESFGIVLLEAWLAGKPVIANKDCAAFHDMAIDGQNALLVSRPDLASALQRLLDDRQFGNELAMHGKLVAAKFDWNAVSQEFVQACTETAR